MAKRAAHAARFVVSTGCRILLRRQRRQVSGGLGLRNVHRPFMPISARWA